MVSAAKLLDRRKSRVRHRIAQVNHAGRLRLSVFRSNRYIYAQLIDDARSCTVTQASSLEKDLKSRFSGKNDKTVAQAVGKLLAERAVQLGHKQVVFDRGNRLFHGRIQALAEAAREGGLSF